MVAQLTSSAATGIHVHGEPQRVSLVVGNLESGTHRTLVADTRGEQRAGQHRHPHAYMTADNRNVVFNANPAGGPTQVWAARIPDGFLERLA